MGVLGWGVFVTVFRQSLQNLNIVSTYLNDLNQGLKNYYSTNENET